MNLFCHAKMPKNWKGSILQGLFFQAQAIRYKSYTGSVRAPGHWKISARTKVLSILTLERNRLLRGDFDSVQFAGDLPKSGDKRPKNPGQRVSGCKCQRTVT